MGNTLIVVEHDEDTMLQADEILDLGPGAGDFGGEIVAYGTPKEIMENKESITGKYLKGDLKIEIPEKRRKWKKSIKVIGAKGNNLKSSYRGKWKRKIYTYQPYLIPSTF